MQQQNEMNRRGAAPFPKMHAHRRPRRVLGGDPSRVLLARALLAALSLPSAARYATSASTETSTTPANGETSPAIAALGARTNAAVAIEVAVARASVAIVVVVVVVVVDGARARHRARARLDASSRNAPSAASHRARGHHRRRRHRRRRRRRHRRRRRRRRRAASRFEGRRRPTDRTTDRQTDRQTDGVLDCGAPPIFQNVRVVSVYKDSNVSIVVFETNSRGVPPRTSRDRSEEKEPTLSTRTDPSRKAGRGRRRDGDERRARLGEARHIDASE